MLLNWMLAGLFVLEIVVACSDPLSPLTTQLPGPLCLRCIILSPLLIYPPTAEPLSPLPPAHEGQVVFFLIYENVSCFL